MPLEGVSGHSSTWPVAGAPLIRAVVVDVAFFQLGLSLKKGVTFRGFSKEGN